MNDYQHMHTACMLHNGDHPSPAAVETKPSRQDPTHSEKTCPKYSAMQLLSGDNMPITLQTCVTQPSIHTEAHVHPHPYTHAHAHSWTREAQLVTGARDVRIVETNVKLTSIFLPSTIVPCSLSRAFSASALFSNVTKPKP